MATPVPDVLCPKCEKPLGFLKQVAEFVEMADGEPACPAMLNIWCENCKDMTTSVYWEENAEAEAVEIPALREVMDGNDVLMINKPKEDRDS